MNEHRFDLRIEGLLRGTMVQGGGAVGGRSAGRQRPVLAGSLDEPLGESSVPLGDLHHQRLRLVRHRLPHDGPGPLAAASPLPAAGAGRLPGGLHDLLDVLVRIADALGARGGGAVADEHGRQRRRGVPGGGPGCRAGPWLHRSRVGAGHEGRPRRSGPGSSPDGTARARTSEEDRP